ncbi:tetratricopeptide repeat protein [Maribacter sp. 2210JD10-5]|uniref:tetratricopeptide repeat-containing sensor histidine kinase n=1 Tax=Maribacter sp. 2210JD10-5 TaxID=3386272 RepID=UPI0039BC5BFA
MNILKYQITLILFLVTNLSSVAQKDSIIHLNQQITNLQLKDDFAQNDTLYINLLNKLAWEIKFYNQDSLKLLSDKAFELSKALNYKKGILNSLANQSLYHLYVGNSRKAIDLGERILKKEYKDKFPYLVMRAQNQIGQAYFILSDYPNTYKTFLKAIKKGEELNATEQLFIMKLNLGTMFLLLEDYEEAEKFYTQIMNNSTYLEKKPINKGMVYSNLGFLYLKTRDFEKAQYYLEESTKIFAEFKVAEWLAFVYGTKGDLNLVRKNEEEALQYYDKADSIHQNLEDTKGKADITYGKGMAYMALKKADKAKKLFNESLQLYKSFNLKTGLEKCYRSLYMLAKNENNTEESLTYLELAGKFSDSILREKNKANIVMLRTKNNFENEKEKLKKENLNNSVKQKTYIQLSTAALLISIMIAFLIFKSRSAQKKLNLELEDKTKILLENQEKLNQTNKTQDKLFSIVGHDLRGPIVSLKELVSLCLEEKETGEIYFKKFAPKLSTKLDHIHFTLDNLLNWGRTQMQGASISSEEVDIKEEIDAIFNLFKPNLKQKKLSYANKIADGFIVFVDFNHFNIIFRNLISNAIKFTPEGGHIDIDAIKRNKYIVISVTDTGLGMSHETINKVFTRLEHYSTYGTNMEKGTGLGLLLCKEMVQKNKGTITVESERGKGTTFNISIPKFG